MPHMAPHNMKAHTLAFTLSLLSSTVLADDQGIFLASAGGGTKGPVLSIGGGTKVDVIEISSIDLGAVAGSGSAKFVGASLVQNATPINGFNFLFRIGIGRATTTFANGSRATMSGLGNGIYFGIGEQYQLGNHLVLRGELNRITYAASTDGRSKGISYPLTLSALYVF